MSGTFYNHNRDHTLKRPHKITVLKYLAISNTKTTQTADVLTINSPHFTTTLCYIQSPSIPCFSMHHSLLHPYLSHPLALIFFLMLLRTSEFASAGSRHGMRYHSIHLTRCTFFKRSEQPALLYANAALRLILSTHLYLIPIAYNYQPVYTGVANYRPCRNHCCFFCTHFFNTHFLFFCNTSL